LEKTWRNNFGFLPNSLIENFISSIARIIMIIGGFMLIWGLISIFCTQSSRGLKTMVRGFLLLFLGAILLNLDFFIFFSEMNEGILRGYH